MLKAVESTSKSQNETQTGDKEIPIQPVSLDIWDKKISLKNKNRRIC